MALHSVWELLPLGLIDAVPSYVTAHYATIKDYTNFEEISFIKIISSSSTELVF